jgi:hypothetical protein
MPLSTTEDVPVAEADARIGGRYRLGRLLASGGIGLGAADLLRTDVTAVVDGQLPGDDVTTLVSIA